MFKLPSRPTTSSDVHELADFMELLSWAKKVVSLREVATYLGQADDNEAQPGIEDSEDRIIEFLGDVMQELESRSEACGTGYPFYQDHTGSVLRYKRGGSDARGRVYCYLLLSTRLNMDTDRVQGDIDGTHVLEELAASVLRNYLGDRALSFVFGTSAHQSHFAARVDDLCRRLNEGQGYRSLSGRTKRSGDDKLDVVVWKAFSDMLPGKIIVFAQCKTGTSWRRDVAQLQPDAFRDKWIRAPFGMNPLRAVVVSEAEDRFRFPETVRDTGLFFDRCRIVDFCPNLDGLLLQRLSSWTDAAFALVNRTLR